MKNKFMAQIENTAFMREGKSFSHSKKQILRIDMTPMVDLGFLLITFFVFTTTMSIPKATDLFMPSDKPDPKPPKLIDDLALTILLIENNKIYYYNGNWEDAKNNNQIFETNYSTYNGIGKIMMNGINPLIRNNTIGAGSRVDRINILHWSICFRVSSRKIEFISKLHIFYRYSDRVSML